MSQPLLGHLDPDFLTLLDQVSDNLRQIFRTQNELTFAISGTGSAGMEASLVNVLEPGDSVIIGVNGVFGQRLLDTAMRLNAEVHALEAPMGRVFEPERLIHAHKKIPQAKALVLVHAETSTGARQPLEEVGAYLKDKETLFIVDAVTSLGGIPLETDGWGMDVCYSGTQKCLSVPPGLSPITFSQKALKVIEGRKTPVSSWYLDVTMIRRYLGSERLYHHTAPISMLYGLFEGTRVVLEEELEDRWKRHETLGYALQSGLENLGFKLVVDEPFRLPQLSCASVPEGVSEAWLRKELLGRFGIEVGGGLGELKGRTLRIGLMGETAKPRNVTLLLEALDTLLSQNSK
jgi:alanine-glyoxylate transaminase/serine-glyoxylate transaminase/serine-pyruvate transaminase